MMNQIEVTDEERLLPSILHQKLSSHIAERVFGISNPSILDGIKYHTTSRANPTELEKEVFLADKMSWKEAGPVKGLPPRFEGSLCLFHGRTL